MSDIWAAVLSDTGKDDPVLIGVGYTEEQAVAGLATEIRKIWVDHIGGVETLLESNTAFLVNYAQERGDRVSLTVRRTAIGPE